MADTFDALPGEELDSALRRASAYLGAVGVASPLVDAELLAAHLLEKQEGEPVSRGRVQALALMGRPAPAGFAELVAQRAERVPLQHLTGQAFFRSLTLSVGPGVFVPRPETELLVEHGLEALAGVEKPLVVDLCTGSGAIAGSVAFERPDARVYAVELSELAHAWAQKNLAPLGVELVLGDATLALEDLVGRCDAVLSNPPYIPDGAVPKDPEVRDHDPDLALYGGGEDGMRVPRAIVQRAFELLRPGGFFILEHAETQRDLMVTALHRAGFERIQSIDDLAGKPRHTSGYKPLAGERNVKE